MIKRNTNISKFVGTAMLCVFLISSVAVKAQMEKGDKLFSKFEYERALEAYEKEYNENNSANPYLTRRIGLTYRNLGDIEASAIWFKRTLDMDQSNNLDLLYYAEALKFIKEYEKSLDYYEMYAKKAPNDRRAITHLYNKKYYEKLLTDTTQYSVNRLRISNDNAQFGITQYNDKYLFSSTGTPNPELTQKVNIFDENPYLDIFVAERGSNQELINVEKVNGAINSKYHDGPIAYDPSNRQLYVTRNNIKRGRPVKDKNGRVNLKIYVFDELENGEWSKKGEELKFNSDDYSVAHPSISSDGKNFYFSSNRPGGYGKADIYVCKRNEDGSWGEPTNLGPKINTEGDESFPFVSNNNLYFSSDGLPGLGGLDIFKVHMIDGNWMSPVNLAHPINSYRDDISFIIESEENKGYFSSNREENKVGDDIYSFKYTPTVNVSAVIVDKYTLLPIEGIIAKIYDENGQVVFQTESNEDGLVSAQLATEDCDYEFHIGDDNLYKTQATPIDICDEVNNVIDLGTLEYEKVEKTMKLAIKDQLTNETVINVGYKIYDADTNALLAENTTNEDGNVYYEFEADRNYRIDFVKENYQAISKTILAESIKANKINRNVFLKALGTKSTDITFNVKDAESKMALNSVVYKIYDADTNELITQSQTLANGDVNFSFSQDKNYRLEFRLPGFDPVTKVISSADLKSNSIDKNILLSPQEDGLEANNQNTNPARANSSSFLDNASLVPSFEGESEMSFIVFNDDMDAAMEDVAYKVYDTDTDKLVAEGVTDKDGKVVYNFDKDGNYRIDFEKDDLAPTSQVISSERMKSNAFADNGSIVPSFEEEMPMSFIVFNDDLEDGMEDVNYKVYDTDVNVLVAEGVTGSDGKLDFKLNKNKNYRIDYTKTGFNPTSQVISSERMKSNSFFDNVSMVPSSSHEVPMSFIVFNDDSESTMEDVTYKVYDGDSNALITQGITGADGMLAFKFDKNKNYRIDYSKDGFEPASQNISSASMKANSVINKVSLQPIVSTASFEFTVQAANSSNALQGVTYKIYDRATNTLVSNGTTTMDGKLTYNFDNNKNYRIDFTKNGYESASKNVDSASMKSNSVDTSVIMKSSSSDVARTDKTLELENIYYDFDKSNIRPDAKITLNKLVGIMKQYPGLRIQMDSHTDSRGSNAYNKALSERREQSAKNYVLAAGIDAQYVQTGHHGETKLVNNCSNDVKCSASAHQLNRRTTFTVLNPEILSAAGIDENGLKQIMATLEDLYSSETIVIHDKVIFNDNEFRLEDLEII